MSSVTSFPSGLFDSSSTINVADECSRSKWQAESAFPSNNANMEVSSLCGCMIGTCGTCACSSYLPPMIWAMCATPDSLFFFWADAWNYWHSFFLANYHHWYETLFHGLLWALTWRVGGPGVWHVELREWIDTCIRFEECHNIFIRNNRLLFFQNSSYILDQRLEWFLIELIFAKSNAWINAC